MEVGAEKNNKYTFPVVLFQLTITITKIAFSKAL